MADPPTIFSCRGCSRAWPQIFPTRPPKGSPRLSGRVSLTVKLEVNAERVERRRGCMGRAMSPGLIRNRSFVSSRGTLQRTSSRTIFRQSNSTVLIFPWLFTPAKADAQGRLRPWLCLVVVRKQPGVELRPAADVPLPVLEIKAPARPGDELPDLSESHFWAHAQVTGPIRATQRQCSNQTRPECFASALSAQARSRDRVHRVCGPGLRSWLQGRTR